jgi:acetyl esterase
MTPTADRPARPPRVADVYLRSPAPRGRARVHWPAAADRTAAMVVVLHPPTAADVTGLVDRLVDQVGAVVLTASAAHVVEAHAVLTWAADHAGELGADPDRLAVVGVGSGAVLVERVVELATDEGWPPLREAAPIWPHDDPGAALVRLAAALSRPQPTR